MMSRVKRVLKHAVTGYIPDGSGNGSPPPLLNQIKEEPSPVVSEPLKQEKSQEPVPFALTEGERAGERAMSQGVSKMPEEEHNEKELEDDEDKKPECYRDFDDTGGYDPTDDECKTCDLADDCKAGSPESKDESEVAPDPEPKKAEKKDEPEEKEVKPDKFTVFKMMRTRFSKEDGTVDFRNAPRTIGDTYTGEPPTKETIEGVLVPQYGGGEYTIINQSTKQVYKKYKFDGAPRDPEEPTVSTAPAQGLVAMQPVPPLGTMVAPTQPQLSPVTSYMQWAQAQAIGKATEQLMALADKYSQTGDTEKLAVVLGDLKEIATGRKDSTPNDRLTDMMMEDRKMMMQMLLEKSKGKETSSSDIVRETMGTMTEMFKMAKEFAPQGEDTGVAMVREVSGVVKDSLKDVTDTVIQVTGSRPLKQVEEPPEKVVYKCERCGHVVDPRFAVCPYCGVKFTGAVSTPKAQPPVVIGQTAPIETFRKPIPPLPPEVKERMEYLKKVAVFIQESHDPAVKGSAAFKIADPEQKVALLFTANFGYGNIMKLAQPWRHSPEIPEGDAIFKVIESANGRLWINKFFVSIRETAKEDGFILDQGTIDHYLGEINKYSVVKFSFRPKPGPEGPATATAPPELKQVKGKTVAMSECPVCHDSVPTLELQDHLFKKHPPIKITNPRALAAIQRGAAVLPRGRDESVMLPPPNSPETTVPNGNGSDEEDGT